MPNTDSEIDIAQQQRGRRLLIALGLLFFLPIAISAILAFGGFRVSGLFDAQNYGQVAKPVAELKPFSLPIAYLPPETLEDVEEGPIELDMAQSRALVLAKIKQNIDDEVMPDLAEGTAAFGDFWRLVVVVDNDCGLECQERLIHVRSMTGQRKTMDLVKRLTLVRGEPTDAFVDWLKTQHKDAPLAVIPEALADTYPKASLQNSSGLLQPLSALNQLAPNTIYLVSPRQKVGLYWLPEQADTKAMLKEIEHLLKYRRGG